MAPPHSQSLGSNTRAVARRSSTNSIPKQDSHPASRATHSKSTAWSPRKRRQTRDMVKIRVTLPACIVEPQWHNLLRQRLSLTRQNQVQVHSVANHPMARVSLVDHPQLSEATACKTLLNQWQLILHSPQQRKGSLYQNSKLQVNCLRSQTQQIWRQKGANKPTIMQSKYHRCSESLGRAPVITLASLLK